MSTSKPLVSTCLIKYGTVFTNNVSTVIKCPQWLALTDPNSETTPFECTSLFPEERTSPQLQYTGKHYPSVSTLLGSTDNMDNLYRWQCKIVNEIGHSGFLKMMRERMSSGTEFHSMIENLLKELKQHGQIKRTDDQILDDEKVKKHKLHSYIECLLPFLRELKSEDVICLEEKTLHHYFCYNGRYDAIIRIDGVPTLVDWKTINAGSTKSIDGNLLTPRDLFNNPVQIAAYVAAVNSNPEGNFVKICGDEKVTHGAIICAFERSGHEFQKIDLNSKNILTYSKNV